MIERPSTSTLPEPAAPSDWLERVLVENAREDAAAYIDDAGFTAKVMSRLPVPVTLPKWRKPAVVMLWAMVRWERKLGIVVLETCGVDLKLLEQDIEDVLNAWPHVLLRRSPTSRPGGRPKGASEIEQVQALGFVQVERAGDRFEYAV